MQLKILKIGFFYLNLVSIASISFLFSSIIRCSFFEFSCLKVRSIKAISLLCFVPNSASTCSCFARSSSWFDLNVTSVSKAYCNFSKITSGDLARYFSLSQLVSNQVLILNFLWPFSSENLASPFSMPRFHHFSALWDFQ